MNRHRGVRAAVKFIATADWQLGMTAHFLDDEARPRFHQARFDAVRRIGELAEERGAGFVVVCGDIFESNQLHRAIISRAFEVLRGFTVPVVLLPGNHDPLDSMSIYDAPAFRDRLPDNVHVLRDSQTFEVLPGVELIGAPWFSKRPVTDLVADACAALSPIDGTGARIIVGHGAASSLDPDRDSLATIDQEALQKVLDDGCAHVALLGDRHGTYEVAPRIWYPGTPEVTHRREENPGNVLLVQIAGDEVDVEPVRVGTWRFETLEYHLNSQDDVDSLERLLADKLDKDRTGIWLRLSGTLSTAAHARLERVLEEASDVFALVTHWERHKDLAVVPDDHDFADLGLSGFAQQTVEDLSALASGADEDQARQAQDALGLLYRLTGAGR